MIIKRNKEEFISYLEDSSNLKGDAEILYLPQKENEVIEALRDCFKKRIPLTVSGARTGTVAGAVPLEGALISLENLNKIIDIDKEKRIIYAQAGINLEDLEKEVNRFGLSLKAKPTETLATLGGAISTSASGLRGFKYGGIRRYVRKIKVALITGEIMEIERGKVISSKRKFSFNLNRKRWDFSLPSYKMPKTKHQAGYFVEDNMDLIDLFIGSESTLGIILEAEVFLHRLRKREIFECVVFFKKEEDALEFVEKIKRREDVFPASLEFFDENSLKFLSSFYPQVVRFKAAVYFEDDQGFDLEERLEKWSKVVKIYGADLDESWFADDLKGRKKLYEFRHRLPEFINEFLKRHKQVKVSSDCSVPEEKFLQMYKFYKKIGEESGIGYVNFGHIGENHLHFNFLPANSEEYKKAEKFIKEIAKKAVELGGTISAEHGIGKLKKEYLKLLYSPYHIEEMKELKKAFDPFFLLGRGNIFDPL